MSGTIDELQQGGEKDGGVKDLQLVVSERFQQRLVSSYEGLVEDRSELQRLFQEGLREFCGRLDEVEVFDFCIISSDHQEDIEMAYKIKHCLTEALRIRGCLLSEAIRVGKDILGGHEEIMDRSSKILFLLTKNFNKDNFCQRVQNGAVFQALMEKTKKTEREKCVPVFLESIQNIRVPLALSGIAGIKFYDIENNKPMLRKTFSHYETTQKKNQQKLHEKFCKEIMDSKIRDYLQEQQEALEAGPASQALKPSRGGHENGHLEASIVAALQAAGKDSSEIAIIAAQLRQALPTQSTAQPTVFVSGSSGVTVGNHHTINIITNPRREDSTSESESDSDT